jgi:hypothetical protein
MPLQVTQKLEDTAVDLQKAREERKVLEAVHRQGTDDLAAAKRKFEASLGELQTSEAGMAVGQVSDTAVARKKWLDSRNACDFIAARLAGLAPKLEAARLKETEAQWKFDDQWNTFGQSVLDAFHEEYLEAASALYSVLDCGLAVSLALTPLHDAQTLFHHLGQIAVPTLRGKKAELHRAGRSVWQVNPEARERHSEITTLKARLLGAKEQK